MPQFSSWVWASGSESGFISGCLGLWLPGTLGGAPPGVRLSGQLALAAPSSSATDPPTLSLFKILLLVLAWNFVYLTQDAQFDSEEVANSSVFGGV